MKKTRIPAWDTGDVVVVLVVEELKNPKKAATGSQASCGYPYVHPNTLNAEPGFCYMYALRTGSIPTCRPPPIAIFHSVTGVDV